MQTPWPLTRSHAGRPTRPGAVRKGPGGGCSQGRFLAGLRGLSVQTGEETRRRALVLPSRVRGQPCHLPARSGARGHASTDSGRLKETMQREEGRWGAKEEKKRKSLKCAGVLGEEASRMTHPILPRTAKLCTGRGFGRCCLMWNLGLNRARSGHTSIT